MSNRINGDFDPGSIDAFRAAYAAQILEPEDQETDPYTGLPTELVLNTSPWIQHTGLWKANDGTDKYFQPNQTLVPGQQDSEGEYEGYEDEEDEEDEEELTEEELDALLASLNEELDPEDEDLELTEEELDALVEELLLGNSEEDTEDGSEEGISDEEIDALIAELEAELEGFEVEDENEE
jgi:hypothetical protein